MVRFIFLILLTFQCAGLSAQAKHSDFTGSWVKVGIRYYSGENLPPTHILKNQYIKIKFTPDQKAFKSIMASTDGTPFNYTIHKKGLTIGFLEYSYSFLSKDTLVLMEHYEGKLIDQSYVYVFVRENQYQNSIPLQKNMYYIRKKDTVFLESEKIYADFLKKDEDFHSFLLRTITERADSRKNPMLLATFIITDKGKIDSITIQRSINQKFDKQFKEALMLSEKYWAPAVYKGRAVAIQKIHRIQFVSSVTMFFEDYPKAIEEMQKKNYHVAISLFTRCLNAMPNDSESLFNRGVCYLQTNQLEKACADWQAIKQQDDTRADHLIAAHCKQD